MYSDSVQFICCHQASDGGQHCIQDFEISLINLLTHCELGLALVTLITLSVSIHNLIHNLYIIHRYEGSVALGGLNFRCYRYLCIIQATRKTNKSIIRLLKDNFNYTYYTYS